MYNVMLSFPELAFKSECETAHSLYKDCGLVLLRAFLLEFTCIFSVGKYFSHAVAVMTLLTFVSEKTRTHILIDRSGMAPNEKSAF